jgi:hypothetical protein
MTDPRLRRHPFGFLEVINRPTTEALSAYYADTYYQAGQGSLGRNLTAFLRPLDEQEDQT